MKITGTRSSITIEIEGKSVTVKGELTTTPAFYAAAESIKDWDPPFDGQAITENEKQAIIRRVVEETKDNELRIYFD